MWTNKQNPRSAHYKLTSYRTTKVHKKSVHVVTDRRTVVKRNILCGLATRPKLSLKTL